MALVLEAGRLRVGLNRQFPFAVLLQQRTAQRGALQDGLYQMILLQRLGQILIHLRLDALLPVAHHGVGR